LTIFELSNGKKLSRLPVMLVTTVELIINPKAANILRLEISPRGKKRLSQSPRGWTPTNARDNQRLIVIVAPRQSNSRVMQISLALSSGRDNHPPAATAEMAILIVAVFPSRLTRYNCA
jgi:hypothetical protein